jgi:hypothetical protein
VNFVFNVVLSQKYIFIMMCNERNILIYCDIKKNPSTLWSYIWIYNYLCNQCLSPLMLWVRIPLKRGVIITAIEPTCNSRIHHQYYLVGEVLGYGVMVFNATFNNISVISWLSVLLVPKMFGNCELTNIITTRQYQLTPSVKIPTGGSD